MSHVGVTLRRLRVESGLGLRDLARRLGVSSAYLSRVETGHDAPPTSERLEAIAAELGVPPSMLLEVGHRANPLIERYLAEEPQAATLFLAIARSKLTAEELSEVRGFVERRFPGRARALVDEGCRLVPLLGPKSIAVGVRCDGLEEACELGAMRLADALGSENPRQMLTLVQARLAAVHPSVGNGVAVVTVVLPRIEPRAALLVLDTPVASTEEDDGTPITVIVLIALTAGSATLLQVAHVARLASRGLAGALDGVRRPEDALDEIRGLELLG